MKLSINFFLLVSCFVFFSCKNDDVTLVNSSISNSGAISGKISNWSVGSLVFDSVAAFSWGEGLVELGISEVTTDGIFSINLINPPLYKMGRVSGIVINDTTAMTGSVVVFQTLKNGSEMGEVIKCNYSNSDSLNKVGMSYSQFVYSDRVLILKGTHTETDVNNWSDFTYVQSTVCDVKLNKGWNEIVDKLVAYSVTSKAETKTISLTNVITDDLKWKCFMSGVELAPSKVKGKSHYDATSIFGKK